MYSYTEDQINFFGEELRRKSFVGEGLGCYANFEVNSHYNRIEEERLKAVFLHYFLDDFDLVFDTLSFNQIVKDIQLYVNYTLNIIMAYYWDGDGALLFITPHYRLYNNDCKQINNWRIL